MIYLKNQSKYTVMKRPLIVDDQGLLALGWGKDVQERFGV